MKLKELILPLMLLTPVPAAAQPFSPLTAAPGPLVDPHAWAVSHTQWSADFSLLPNAPNANEFGLDIETRIAGPTGARIPYERAAILGEISTSDPSTGDITHDAVGITGMGRINSDNPSGRAWGLYGVAATKPGGDGLLLGGELDVVNNGRDEPTNAQSDSKVGLFIAGFGTKPITTAIDLEASNAHTGIFAPPDTPMPKDANLIDSGIKVRWSDGAIQVNNPAGGYKTNSINVRGGYFMNGIRADMPVYNADGTPWAPDGAFIIIADNQVYLCSDRTCFALATY